MNRLGTVLLYLAALGGGLYSAYRPTFDSGFARVQVEPGDGMLNHYLLEHTWRVVSDPGYRGTLWSPPFFYPEPRVLGYSENILGSAPIYWGLRLVLPDHLAHQWWMILCSALNFAAFAAVARWLGCNHLVSALGGFLWAFGVVHVWHAEHVQLIPRFWMPVAAYYAWQLASTPGLRPLNRTLGCVFLQAATGVYSGWFLAAGVAVFVPAAAACTPGGVRGLARFLWQNRCRAALIVAAWAAVFVGLFLPYRIANEGFTRTYADCLTLMPTPVGWLSPPPGGRWCATLRPHVGVPRSTEELLFCGFGLYLLVLAAGLHALTSRFIRNRPRELELVAACVVTAAAWVLLTLDWGYGVSGWWAVRLAPGGQAIRCVARVYLVVYLFGTLGVVVWLNAMTARLRSRWLRAAVLLAAAGPVVFEQTGCEPRCMEKADFYPRADRTAEDLRGADIGYVVPVGFGRFQLHGDVIGMWAGLRANVPVVNGYSGRYPDGYELYRPDVDAALREWLAGRFRGRVAVVDPHHPGRVRYVTIE